jgi:diadenosine tetraphosphate (Ap4A) HIT family hydrolase
MTEAESQSADCGTCARIRTRDAGQAPAWDAIIRTGRWDVVHSYDTSLLGWLVLVPVRHLVGVEELTGEEAAELGALLRLTSRFLKQDTGCLKTYVMQFAEHPDHPHVHFHVVPRHADLPADHRGPGIFAYLSVSDAERVTEEAMTGLAHRLRLFHQEDSGT